MRMSTTQTAAITARPKPVWSDVSIALLSRRVAGKYERWLKPVLDWTGGLLLTLITLPVVLLAAIVVLIDLGGPVILRQERVGKNGKVFRVFKLRSMHPDRRRNGVSFVGEERRRTHKSASDPRLTRVGRFIRKWSLDELPQLWNVVLGHMSLVGPRPELVSVVGSYEEWQHQRHLVKPGVTGLWQVSARGTVPLHQATELDLEYIQKLSFTTDLRILLQTIPAALGDRTGH